MPKTALALARIVPLAFFAVFFIYPLASILERGLRGRPTISAASAIDVIWFTLWQAVLSTALTLCIGMLATAALRHLPRAASSTARAMMLVPFVLPTVVVGAAVNELFTALSISAPLAAILTAHAVFNVAVVVRVVGAHWSMLDPRPAEAATMLGAPPAAVFRTVTLPRLRPAIVAAALIVFLFCFTSFGVIMIVGSPRQATIETEIWRYAVQRTDFATAAVLTIVQLAFVIALVAVAGRVERRLGTAETAGRAPLARRRGRLAGLALAPAAALIVPPLAVLVERSLRDSAGGYGIGNYRALGDRRRASATLLVPPRDALWNSLSVALVAAVIATVIGALAASARGRGSQLTDRTLMLPLGVSAVSLGFGFLIALDTPPLDLRTSWWLIPIAQALVGLPFVLRIARPALRSIDPRLRHAAAMLGAPPATVWRTVEWPVLRRALVVGWLFAFAVALGEFGATSFLARPDNPTVPVAIFRLLSQPGRDLRGMAMALAVILSAVVAVTSLVSERLRPRGAATL